MPKAGLVLGFIGSGETSAENTTALLSDYVDANGAGRFVLPLTPALWSPGLATVADFALENRIPYEAVIVDETAKAKGLKKYLDGASVKTKVAKPELKIANSLGTPGAKLVVLWDNEDTTSAVLQLVKEKDIPILDLTAGLQEVELEITNQTGETKEQTTMSDTQALTWGYLSGLSEAELEAAADAHGVDHSAYPTWDEVRDKLFEDFGVYDQEYLDALDEAGLGQLAEALGIDHNAIATWDEVKAEILASQSQTSPPTEAGELPTPEQVDTMEFAELKAFAEANGIDVPARTRTPGYQQAIKDWLSGASSAPAASSGEVEGSGGGVGLSDDALAKLDRIESIYQAVTNLGVSLDEIKTSFETGLQDLATMLSSTNGSTPASAPAKAAAPSKAAAPAKKAPVVAKAAAPAKKAAAAGKA